MQDTTCLEGNSQLADCCICLCPLESDIDALPCAHTFHKRCLRRLLRHEKRCPLCRSPAVDPVNDSRTPAMHMANLGDSTSEASGHASQLSPAAHDMSANVAASHHVEYRRDNSGTFLTVQESCMGLVLLAACFLLATVVGGWMLGSPVGNNWWASLWAEGSWQPVLKLLWGCVHLSGTSLKALLTICFLVTNAALCVVCIVGAIPYWSVALYTCAMASDAGTDEAHKAAEQCFKAAAVLYAAPFYTLACSVGLMLQNEAVP